MKYAIIIFVLIFPSCLCSQDFTNQGLEGISGINNVPASWFQIDNTDPISTASAINSATSDLVSIIDLGAGLIGNPQSGFTFVSGLIGTDTFNSISFDEGIKQTVSGLTINKLYTIGFYQTVVKQNNALDDSGAWKLYVDNTLIGNSAVSTSSLVFDSIDLVWDYRTISFTASATSHEFKFLPLDDDNDIAFDIFSTTGALRMGIDSIYFLCSANSVNIGNDTTICEGQSVILDATKPSASYIWQDNSTSPTFNVGMAGAYWVSVTNSCGTVEDTIDISYKLLPIADIGEDETICIGDTLVLDASYPFTFYLWQDSSTNTSIKVYEEGEYKVAVRNNCGTTKDSIYITIDSCIVEPPCQGGYLYFPSAFSPNADGVNDIFRPQFSCEISEVKLMIFDRWGENIFVSNQEVTYWDGTYKGKSNLGIFAYSFSFIQNDSLQSRNGIITILK